MNNGAANSSEAFFLGSSSRLKFTTSHQELYLYIVFLLFSKFAYLYIILFSSCVLSCHCHSVALWSFSHYNKFLVCVNIPG